MNVERARAFLLSLPHCVETMQWGANLVFWAGDKALGGKMFALIDLDQGLDDKSERDRQLVISYVAGPERYHELLEREGFVPAPYMARVHWVAVESWSHLRDAAWQAELTAAHALTMAKLSKRTLEALALPGKEHATRIAASSPAQRKARR